MGLFPRQFLLHQCRPKCHAGHDGRIVEVVGGVVVQRAVHRRAVAEPDIAAGSLPREKGEIVAGGRGREGGAGLVAEDGFGGAQSPLRRVRLVDDGRNAADEFITCFDAEHRRGAPGEPADFRFQLVAHISRIGARRAADFDEIGNDVERLRIARLHRTGADDGRLQRIDDAADDVLQRGEERARRRYRIAAEMRFGAVGADALEGDAPTIGRGELRAFHHGHFVNAQPRHVVQAIDSIAGKKVEQPILDHFFRAAPAFFGWLENEMHGAGKITGLGEVTCRTKQHGGVAIMAAGMHLAGKFRFIGPLGHLRHGKRIHVGPQADAARAVAHLQRADDAGAAETAMHLQPGALEKIGDDGARSLLFETQFRMGVQIMTKLRQKWHVLADPVQQSHGKLVLE
ncbi:Hypothetical protein AT6N2_L1918 [Agrobacterium tumefaciens]|nr:Hypothetical protein AT6N2_L1918 [Agrobacterium tumefaciens]